MMTVQFSYSIGQLIGNATIASVSIDLDGDGVAEFSGPSLSGAPDKFTYAAPGVYTPLLRVVDSNNQSYLGTTRITVQDAVLTRGMLCDVFGYLKDRLNEGDSNGAVLAFQPSVQDQYLTLFNSLSNLPSVVPKLGTISTGLIGSGYAEMLLVRDNPNQSRNGFPLRMTRGADGVWRISEM